MKKYLLLFIISLSFATCRSPQRHENGEATSFDTSEVRRESREHINTATKEQTVVVERLIPETIATIGFDTLLNEQEIQIFLTKQYLQSYVINEYQIKDTIYQDKYRNAQIHLKIEKAEAILVDTVFNKSSFLPFTDKEFLKIARFHNYWLRELSGNRLEFFGVISKPETDWSFAFSHYFDIDRKTLFVEPYKEEGI